MLDTSSILDSAAASDPRDVHSEISRILASASLDLEDSSGLIQAYLVVHKRMGKARSEKYLKYSCHSIWKQMKSSMIHPHSEGLDNFENTVAEFVQHFGVIENVESREAMRIFCYFILARMYWNSVCSLWNMDFLSVGYDSIWARFSCPPSLGPAMEEWRIDLCMEERERALSRLSSRYLMKHASLPSILAQVTQKSMLLTLLHDLEGFGWDLWHVMSALNVFVQWDSNIVGKFESEVFSSAWVDEISQVLIVLLRTAATCPIAEVRSAMHAFVLGVLPQYNDHDHDDHDDHDDDGGGSSLSILQARKGLLDSMQQLMLRTLAALRPLPPAQSVLLRWMKAQSSFQKSCFWTWTFPRCLLIHLDGPSQAGTDALAWSLAAISHYPKTADLAFSLAERALIWINTAGSMQDQVKTEEFVTDYWQSEARKFFTAQMAGHGNNTPLTASPEEEPNNNHAHDA
jgi:hypothetical protein